MDGWLMWEVRRCVKQRLDVSYIDACIDSHKILPNYKRPIHELKIRKLCINVPVRVALLLS